MIQSYIWEKLPLLGESQWIFNLEVMGSSPHSGGYVLCSKTQPSTSIFSRAVASYLQRELSTGYDTHGGMNNRPPLQKQNIFKWTLNPKNYIHSVYMFLFFSIIL